MILKSNILLEKILAEKKITEDRINRYNHEKNSYNLLSNNYNQLSQNNNISREISQLNNNTDILKNYDDIKENPSKPRIYEQNRPALPLPRSYKAKKPISDPINFLPVNLKNIDLRASNEYTSLPLQHKRVENHLSKPEYLEDLRKSIESLNRERNYRNPATLEKNGDRLERVRIGYNLGEKMSKGEDNPYGREALIQHQMRGEGIDLRRVEEGIGEFGDVKRGRKEYGRRFDDILNRKIGNLNYKYDFV